MGQHEGLLAVQVQPAELKKASEIVLVYPPPGGFWWGLLLSVLVLLAGVILAWRVSVRRPPGT